METTEILRRILKIYDSIECEYKNKGDKCICCQISTNILNPFNEDLRIERFERNAGGIQKSVETTSEYWDCECETDYIHSKKIKVCERCNTNSEEQPDSRVAEVYLLPYIRNSDILKKGVS